MRGDEAHKVRNETMDWLLRPFMYALSVALLIPGFAGLRYMQIGMDAAPEMLLAFPAALLVVSGLLIWGIVRMVGTAQGRAAPTIKQVHA